MSGLACPAPCSPSTDRSSSTARSSPSRTRSRTRDGHAVDALLGAVNLILRIAADCRPRAIVVCFGAEAAAYRTELYPPYHAHRPELCPTRWDWQFARAPELFAAFGWSDGPSAEDLEADDLLGALAAGRGGAPAGRALIMTGDRDMYQCAGERVSVVYLKQAIRRLRRGRARPRCAAATASARSSSRTSSRSGATPPTASPGAPGIGAKTASDLLQRHGSLDGCDRRRRPGASAGRGGAARQRRTSSGPSARLRRCGCRG